MTLTFREFVALVNPRFQFYAHLDKLIDVLQRVVDGDLLRVMVFMPPRHGKSETVSRLFTAYYLYRYPERWVGLSSYAAGLAYTLSRNAREHFRAVGGSFDTEGVEHWTTTAGGGMWAAGVGGPATGKGFHLGIVDDPLKNAEEAASETIREKHKDWWRSTFYTRQEPGAAIVVIQTRWNEDDLSGWLLSEEDDDEPERWHIVNLPAIAEADLPMFPPTCTVEPDTRDVGTALCPERYPLRKLNALRRRVGSYFWEALYQGRPTPTEGGIIKRHWWRYWQPKGANLGPVRVRMADGSIFETSPVDVPERFDELIQSWDMAFKETKTSDFVAGQVWGRAGPNKYLLDYYKERADLPKSLTAVQDMTDRWPGAAAKYVEDKANGPAVIQTLRIHISGLIAVEPLGNKESRVYAVQPDIEAGNVYVPHPRLRAWVDAFITNCAGFPNVAHDDDVDAMTQAILKLTRYGVEYAPNIWR